MKKVFYFLFIVLFIVSNTFAYALTAEEMLLLKRGGISDEKILEIQRKEGSAPAPKINPFDWNEDGKKDIVLGQVTGEISLFLNMGNNKQPIFSHEIKLNDGDLDVGSSSSPAMVDWNGDGKKDLVVGNH